MSKMDELRALREARYAARAAGPATTRSAPARVPSKPATRATAPTADAGVYGEALCGHRSMNGRTCTRESGHAAKSHRYS